MPDNEFQEIPIAKITNWCDQERTEFPQESMDSLVQSIKTVGIIEPICIFADGEVYTGFVGRRRYLGAKAAGLLTIPARILAKPRSEADAIEVRMTENEQREPLNPIERANGYARLLKERGKGASETAKRLGVSAGQFSKSMSLLVLSPEIQQQVARGEIGTAKAYELAQIPDESRRAELAAHAAAGTLTRDALTARRKASKRNGNDAVGSAPSRVTVKLGAGRSVTICATALDCETIADLLSDLVVRIRQARSKGWTLKSFLRVQDDLANQSPKE